MTLFNDVKTLSLQARKGNLPEKGELILVVSNLASQAKDKGLTEPTDDMCLQVFSKTLRDIKDSVEYQGHTTDAQAATQSILQSLMPAQLTEDSIKEKVKGLVADGNKFGDLMAFFKKNHANEYNPKTLALIVKEALK